jgi:hypothetical protein
MKKILITLFLGSFLLSGYSYAGDFTRYAKCYGEMTKAHKARGFHQTHRMMSIQIKETICEAYSNGEDINYEGKM